MNLLVKHPSRGWEFPGSRVEQGENPEDALHREVQEECGIKVFGALDKGFLSKRMGHCEPLKTKM